MAEPPELEGKRLAQRRNLRELVIETFGHQHPVDSAALDASHKTLEVCVRSYKSSRKDHHDIEKIHLPAAMKALSKSTALLRRCKQVRLRERLEEQIRLSISKIIHLEWLLIETQKEQKEHYRSYIFLSEVHAKLLCREICDQIQNKLQRELRDLIYQHVVGRNTVELAPAWSPPVHRVALFRHRSPSNPDVSSLLADCPTIWLEDEVAASQHVFSFAFVGYDFLRELAETWYRTATVITGDVLLLVYFSSLDPWGMCLDVRNFLRKVTIRMPESSVRTRAVQVQQYRHHRRNLFRVETVLGRDTEALITQLAPLTSFNSPTKFLLHVVPQSDFTRAMAFRMTPVEVGMGRSKRKKKAPPPLDVARMERQLTALSGEWRNLCRKLKSLLNKKKAIDREGQEFHSACDELKEFFTEMYSLETFEPWDTDLVAFYVSRLKTLRRKIGEYVSHRQALESRIRRTSEAYRKATCQGIYERIRTSLPRELRDMIYDYILGEPRVAVDHHQNDCRCLSCQDPYAAGPNAAKVIDQTALPAAHLRDPDHVGFLSKELGETWYRKSVFVFDTCGSLSAFVGSDIWNSRLNPRMFIKHIEIHIKLEDFRRAVATNALKEYASNLERSLDVLWNIDQGATIDVVSAVPSHDRFMSLQPLSHPTVKQILWSFVGVIDTLRQQQTGTKRRTRVYVNREKYSWTVINHLTKRGLKGVGFEKAYNK
ncbi:hypothetical protein BKA63DRAFT_579581 [Paraphoma chrysanthemicola]|nr:hypothetical protein BKA63DRAFT_579581 [Paraphoma chrysanthemicola]